MKSDELKKIRKMTPEKRQELLTQLENELTWQKGARKSLVNQGKPMKMRPLRRDIARVKTIMREMGD